MHRCFPSNFETVSQFQDDNIVAISNIACSILVFTFFHQILSKYLYFGCGLPKNSFRFKIGLLKPLDDEFENVEVVQEGKISKYRVEMCL